MYISNSLENSSKDLNFLLILFKTLVYKFPQIGARTHLHGDVKYLERTLLQFLNDWSLWLVPDILYAWSFRLHTLSLIVLESYIAVLLVIENYIAVFDLRDRVLTIALFLHNIRFVIFPVLVNLVELLIFLFLVWSERHVFHDILDRFYILEPGLVVSDDIGMVHFGEHGHLFEHLAIVVILIVDYCLLYSVYVAV